LAECLSLDTLNVGGETPGLLVGTGKGPVLLIPVGKTSLVVRAVAGVTPETLQDLGTGGYCVAADFNADGRCDAMQLFEKGSLLFAGEAPGKFKPPVTTRAPLVRNPASAAPGDYDTDGRLDLVVAGEDGLALLSHTDARRLDNHTYVTGELAYHGNANAPNIHSAWACDINSDGRQGVALFGGGRKPLLFFNRGFACFGWARELDLVGDAAMPPAMGTAEVKKPELKSLESLQFGQKAAAVGDLNADGVTDLLGVDLQSNVWALFGQSMAERPLIVTLAFAPRVQDPVCVTVSGQKYRAGMYVVRPGIPATVGRPAKGVMNLQWFGPDGQPVTSKTMVTASKTVEIRAAAPAAP
jgi:hypothetical protein